MLVTGVVLITSMAAGCVGEVEKVQTYREPGQAITIGVSQEFIIALPTNPATGYHWQAKYNDTVLKLMWGKYEPDKGNALGDIGTKSFKFKALKAGETEITMVYEPWVEDIVFERWWPDIALYSEERADHFDQKEFAVSIK